jgi:acetaldehyde dehydrogenase (acetylating)
VGVDTLSMWLAIVVKCGSGSKHRGSEVANRILDSTSTATVSPQVLPPLSFMEHISDHNVSVFGCRTTRVRSGSTIGLTP